jgi:hypothetical protein
MATECKHFSQIKNVKPHTNGCEECLKMHDTWVQHFHATKHAIMQSIEPGESWKWCYIDEMLFDN